MSESTPLDEECYLAPDGKRWCVKVDDQHAYVPREAFREMMTRGFKFEPTSSPDYESWEKFTAKLKEPVLLIRHKHTWRLTDAVYDGQAVYQCTVCESTAIEGAEQ